MKRFQPYISDKKLHSNFLSFIDSYGESGLKEAMQLYINKQQEYICKTKSSVFKIRIGDIYYLKIQEHNITIHTKHGTYQKYGTLRKELEILAPYGFIKCSQSCIVALDKIKAIQENDIALTNDTKLHISRAFAPKVLIAFAGRNCSDDTYDK